MIAITPDDLKFAGIRVRPWADLQVKSLDPFADCNKGRFSLSAHFVQISCGPYKQDVMCNLAGKKGTSKSWSSVSLGYYCGIRTAIELDNDETKWKDYFDVDRNVAIMDMDKMIDIITSNEKHQVIISDDSGTIQGARKFRSDDNQNLNDVLVVNRTNNCIYFSSAPESSHVDKQARGLPEHQIDFVRNYAGLAAGFGTAKYFERHTDPKTSESYFSYHFWKDMKVLRCVIPAPPKDLRDEYDKLREDGKNRIQAKLKEMKEQRLAGNEGQQRGGGVRNQKAEERRALQEEAQKLYDNQRLLGANKKEAVLELKKQLNINPDTWRYWMKKGEIQDWE